MKFYVTKCPNMLSRLARNSCLGGRRVITSSQIKTSQSENKLHFLIICRVNTKIVNQKDT